MILCSAYVTSSVCTSQLFAVAELGLIPIESRRQTDAVGQEELTPGLIRCFFEHGAGLLHAHKSPIVRPGLLCLI